MLSCESCEEHQQFLLDNGDGSQVVCKHESLAVIEDSEDNEFAAEAAAAAVDINSSEECGSSSSSSRKRKFPTLKRFAEAGGENLKRKIAPIRKWTSLKIKELFLVKRIIPLEVVINKVKQIKFYAEMEDENETLINVWISDMIKTALAQHPLEDEKTYITALGPAQSRETGFTYNNFAVEEIDDEL